ATHRQSGPTIAQASPAGQGPPQPGKVPHVREVASAGLRSGQIRVSILVDFCSAKAASYFRGAKGYHRQTETLTCPGP
ncbi:MAG: hypothetical protein AAF394_17285, partial [Planctomycetota bacterium]